MSLVATCDAIVGQGPRDSEGRASLKWFPRDGSGGGGSRQDRRGSEGIPRSRSRGRALQMSCHIAFMGLHVVCQIHTYYVVCTVLPRAVVGKHSMKVKPVAGARSYRGAQLIFPVRKSMTTIHNAGGVMWAGDSVDSGVNMTCFSIYKLKVKVLNYRVKMYQSC